MAQSVRIIVFIFWLALVAVSLGFYLFMPEKFTAHSMAEFLTQSGYILILYTVICMLRGLVLLPSTPFIFIGSMLFPEKNFLVMAISMAGILFSSTIIYYFSHLMGFDDFFERKFSNKITYVREKLNQPKGVMFVSLWSFFPLMPTDIICYVAGTMKMKFWKFLLAVFIGELPIVIAYVWAGSSLFDLIFK